MSLREYWAVAITICNERRWDAPFGPSSLDKSKRTQFGTRRAALLTAANRDPTVEPRVVHVTRKAKPKPVKRAVLEGVATVDRPTPNMWPTRVVMGDGIGQCSAIFDNWMRSAEGKRVRLTFEVFE